MMLIAGGWIGLCVRPTEHYDILKWVDGDAEATTWINGEEVKTDEPFSYSVCAIRMEYGFPWSFLQTEEVLRESRYQPEPPPPSSKINTVFLLLDIIAMALALFAAFSLSEWHIRWRVSRQRTRSE
jgi:hypothetical protein